MENSQKWKLIIKPQSGWFDLQLTDLWHYRDLLLLFVKRDFVSMYKQTILGPLWFIIQPVLTTFLFVIVFDRVAHIPTDQAPSPLFYLSGLVAWNYFSTCLNHTATTLTKNTDLFGKVYFPRLIVPLASVISAFISFAIQFCLLMIVMVFYYFVYGVSINWNSTVILIPAIILIIAALGLGTGLIFSALTAKYRDLALLLNFGLQLLLYVTPIIYPLSFVSGQYRVLLLANPLTSLIETFRYALLGSGTYNLFNMLYSIILTVVVLLAGILVFNRAEKNFIDVI